MWLFRRFLTLYARIFDMGPMPVHRNFALKRNGSRCEPRPAGELTRFVMTVLAFVALIQTVTLPMASQAPSQALPATATSPQVKTPDPSSVAASPRNPPVRPSTPPIVSQASAASASAGVSSSLNTRDRTALPTATAPATGLPAGVSGGPTFGGTSSLQTAGH